MYNVKGRQLARVLGPLTPLARIDAKAVDRYIATRLEEGAKRTTVHKELTVLRGTLRLAKRRGEYPYDLDEVMPLDFSPNYKPKERALSMDEIRRLLDALADKPQRRAVVAFILATGATYPSEVVNGRKGDVSDRFTLLRGTKRASRFRRVPVVPHARPWLALATPYGPPFEPWTNIRRDLHNACDEAGIARVSPTDLRRTFGRLLRALGVEPQLLAPAMGHADGRMVERVYGRITPEELAHLLDARLVQNQHSGRTKREKRRGNG